MLRKVRNVGGEVLLKTIDRANKVRAMWSKASKKCRLMTAARGESPLGDMREMPPRDALVPNIFSRGLIGAVGFCSHLASALRRTFR